MTISAQHQDEVEETKDNFVRKERRYGAFSRSFNISNVKTDEIHAQYKNGVLELDLPKLYEEKTQVRKIDIQ